MEQKHKSTSVSKSQNKSTKENRSPTKFQKTTAVEIPKKIITLGICAMKKKVESKPMKEIIKRLVCDQIAILEMWEYLDKDYKAWPKVDALICFYSDGFPYLKAWKYVKKHKPFLINSLDKQEYLWDRTVVYDILKKIHIPVAKHYMVFRDLDYIDEIEAKAFPYPDQSQYITSGNNRQSATQFDDASSIVSPSMKSNTESMTEKGVFDSEECLRKSNKESEEGKKLEKSHVQKRDKVDVPEILEKKSSSAKQFDLRKLSLVPKLSKNEDAPSQQSQNKQEGLKMQPLTAKRVKERDLGSTNGPNYLRKFHEDRIEKLEHYEVEQVDDHILIKSKDKTHKLKKPFVEKPFDAENHQICIYYPESMGGGRKMLFRKMKNSSSKHEEGENCIRRDGNYIYEEFLPTNAFDIKVYTIGCYYMYAEARKSPTLDGVVERDSLGKEKRSPIILTPEEKFIAKKIVQEFGQEVCGFDLLRANGKSYVCDVNGWSFVKSNAKYWNDCAIILRRKIFTKFFPELCKEQNRIFERFKIDLQNGYRPPIIYLSSKKEELRSIVSIFRHGDRSPKLKLKFKTKQQKFINYFIDLSMGKEQQVKIKDAKNLTKLLQITNDVIADSEQMPAPQLTILCQMKAVLESGGQFEGLNRKCQLKIESKDENGAIKKILMVVKWGGQLSAAGYQDALDLGKKIRMQKYSDEHDLLSLHSSYRHDLKTYSSDEGRCIKTAAAFLKGFLNIQGGLAPIITNLVKTDKKAQILLDCTSEQNHSALKKKIVEEISTMLNSEQPLITKYLKFIEEQKIAPQMLNRIREIGTPRHKLQQLYEMIKELTFALQTKELDQIQLEHCKSRSSNHLEQQTKEDIVLIYKRWSKLHKDFFHENQNKFNISKIPQIYDTIRHDLMKNCHIFSNLQFNTETFFNLAKNFAQFVVPNEYGISEEEIISTSQNIASPLLDKIRVDLTFWKQRNYEEQLYWKYKNQEEQSWKHIRTRLYFTSASHMYSLLHLITLGNDQELIRDLDRQSYDKIRSCSYMSYLSQIEIRLYQNLFCDSQDPDRFRAEISISPGYSKDNQIRQISFGKGYTIDKIINFFKTVAKPKDLQKSARLRNEKSQSVPKERGDRHNKHSK